MRRGRAAWLSHPCFARSEGRERLDLDTLGRCGQCNMKISVGLEFRAEQENLNTNELHVPRDRGCARDPKKYSSE